MPRRRARSSSGSGSGSSSSDRHRKDRKAKGQKTSRSRSRDRRRSARDRSKRRRRRTSSSSSWRRRSRSTPSVLRGRPEEDRKSSTEAGTEVGSESSDAVLKTNKEGAAQVETTFADQLRALRPPKGTDQNKKSSTKAEPSGAIATAATAGASKKEKFVAKPEEGSSKLNGSLKSGKKKLEGLGDLSKLQKQLDEERRMLKLFVIKAKQEWEERREQRTSNGTTDDEEYYQASQGEVLGPKKNLQVDTRIGRGVFSSVYKCIDKKDGHEYAVKFIRTNAIMRKVSEKEVETYRHLAKKAKIEDPDGSKYLICLAGLETFEHRGHLCLVFDMLKCDLRFGLRRYGQGKGLPMATVQQYARQMFQALRALRKLKMIHADLKPDNVLMSMDKTSVTLIDFGSAMAVGQQIETSYVQPRYYRAPEVILGVTYDTQIDVWSLGVTLFELATAKMPFVGTTNNAILRGILETCGAFPKKMLKSGKLSKKHFKDNGDFLNKDPESTIPVQRFAKPSKSIVEQLESALREPPPSADVRRHELIVQRLADLVTKCLILDPSTRITPEKALAHDFFRKD